MAAISMETNHGRKTFLVFFSILFHTDHNKYTIKRLGGKMNKTVFRPAPLNLNQYEKCMLHTITCLNNYAMNRGNYSASYMFVTLWLGLLTCKCWEYNDTWIFNGRGMKYALQFSVHERRYLLVTCTRNNVQWIRGVKVGTVSCNHRSSS